MMSRIIHFKCPKCGCKWDMPLYTDLGATWLADEDEGDNCPECGTVGNDI